MQMSKRQLKELKKLLELNKTLEDTLEKMSLMYTELEDIGVEEGNTLVWSLDFPDMENIIASSLDEVAHEQSNHVDRLKDFVDKLEDEVNNPLSEKDWGYLNELAELNRGRDLEGYADYVATFECFGSSIHDPFKDPTGRFAVNPIDYYGVDSLKKMIKEFREWLK